MGVDRLNAFLRRHRTVALETSIFIYFLEQNVRYLSLADAIFSWLERPSTRAVTSTITMTELLVAPYRRSDMQLVNHYYGLLSTYPTLTWLAPDLPVADSAARLRADYRLNMADAIQAATAVHGGGTGFLTNDPAFERIPHFQTMVLERLL